MLILPEDIEEAKKAKVLKYTKLGTALAIPIDKVDRANCVIEKLLALVVLMLENVAR